MGKKFISELLANGGTIVSESGNAVTIATPNGTAEMGGQEYPVEIVRKFNSSGDLLGAYTRTILISGYEYCR